MTPRSCNAALRVLLGAGVLCLAALPLTAQPGGEPQPDNAGPLKLITASLLGGGSEDEIVAAAFAPDGSILLAGNAVDLHPRGVMETFWTSRGAPPIELPPTGLRRGRHPGTYGFVLRLTPDGRSAQSFYRFAAGDAILRGMRVERGGTIHLLAEATTELRLGRHVGRGTFIATVAPDGKRLLHTLFQPDLVDFGVDGNGELLLLSPQGLSRYTPDGRVRRWNATWPSYGQDRPEALTVSPLTGLTAVIGYGMAYTGHEPYRDPYAYGFDREGREVWGLWNPDPSRQAGSRWGGNGLTADTTGHVAAATPDGRILLSLFADGPNNICTRDPRNPDRTLDPTVMDGVFQKTPGQGFHGPAKTSAVFRVEPRTGRLEKGTWLTSWLNKQRANSMSIDDVAGAENGDVWVVGTSAPRCPVREPWYPLAENGSGAGGYLAYFDAGFRLRQCGTFPSTTLRCVAQRNGVVVVAGSTQLAPTREGRLAAERTPVYRALQRESGGGKDGYFAVFRLGSGS